MACGITVAVATREVCRMSVDRVYMPFQVGKALHPPIEFGVTCDNSRDNISSLNGRYSELTGSCWLRESRSTPISEFGVLSPSFRQARQFRIVWR